MNRRTSIVFVLVGIALGVGMVSLRSSDSMARSFIVAVIAALFAAPILIRLDAAAKERLRHLRLPDGSYPARITVTASFRGNSADAVSCFRKSIEALPNFKSIERYEPGTYVRAATQRSPISWGERITVEAKEEREFVEITVRSVPRLWTVTEDLRCNFQNVALVLRYVNKDFPIVRTEPERFLFEVIGTHRSGDV